METPQNGFVSGRSKNRCPYFLPSCYNYYYFRSPLRQFFHSRLSRSIAFCLLPVQIGCIAARSLFLLYVMNNYRFRFIFYDIFCAFFFFITFISTNPYQHIKKSHFNHLLKLEAHTKYYFKNNFFFYRNWLERKE